MNISITNECNRRCDYCFQKSWYLSSKDIPKQEMSLETIAKLIDMEHPVCKDGEKYIKVMGGEPLLYSKLEEMLDMIRTKNTKITFISNISIDTEKLEHILDTYDDIIAGWLINTDYPEAHKDLFIRNFKLFVDRNIGFSMSSTLYPNTNKIMESADRICGLLDIINKSETFDKIPELRISPMTPNHIENPFYDYSMDVLNFLQKVWEVNTCSTHFDCSINACEFHPEVIDMFDKFANVNFSNNTCGTSGPFDVLVDGKVIYCSSTKDIIGLDNIFDYENLNHARDAMTTQWKNYWKNEPLVCDYANCGRLNPAYCAGMCPARNHVLYQMKERGEILC